MNLILDIGNSRVKGYLFDRERIVHKEKTSGEAVSLVKDLLSRFPETQYGISVSTRKQDSYLSDICRQRLSKYIELGSDTPLPINNLYHTPDTLGYDRIAGVVEAHARYPEKNVLVIDAGTAITYDLVTAKGEFAGGNISPGLDMRFKALATFADKLPLVNREEIYPLIGKSTQEAIVTGVEMGILAEVEGIIERFKKDFNKLQVIITGGDAFFFDKKLKSSIFAFPDLTAFGLNRILIFNVQK